MLKTSPMRGLLCAVTALLAACGGEDDNNSASSLPTAIAKLTPNAADVGDTIILDGRNSHSSDSSIRHWEWQVNQAPQYSTAQPSANTEQAEFIADLPGDYQICLTVRDDQASSRADCQPLTISNPLPAAIVPAEIGAIPGQRIQLDGSRSLPPTNGDASLLRYQWDLLAVPQGSQAQLDDGTLPQPRFTPDKEGNYRLQLVVHYKDTVSPAVEVTVSASAINATPVPLISVIGGDPDNWILGQTVTLDASRSSDADGDTLQYRWLLGNADQPKWPEDSQLRGLDQHSGERVTFTPDTLGDFFVQLAVYDGTIRKSTSQTIRVKSLAPEWQNTPPVAVLKDSGSITTNEIEKGAQFKIVGYGSYDPEMSWMNEFYQMQFEWTLLSYPDGFVPQGFDASGVSSERGASLTLSNQIDTEGDYVMQLRVNDGEHWSDPVQRTYTVRIGANRRPGHTISFTGAGKVVAVGQTVTLDGSASQDPDDNQLSYFWQLVDKPDNSQAELIGGNTAQPSFIADVPGPYSAELFVKDSFGMASHDHYSGNGRPARITLLAKSTNLPPMARPALSQEFSLDQPLVIYPTANLEFTDGNPMHQRPVKASLNASLGVRGDAFDPEGDELTYLWTLSEAPQNAEMAAPGDPFRLLEYSQLCRNGLHPGPQSEYETAIELYHAALKFREWTCESLALSPTTPGQYQLTMLTSDGIDTSDPYLFRFGAVKRENYPTLLLEDLHAAVIGSDISLTKYGYAYRQKVFPYHVKKSGSSPIFQSYIKEKNHEYMIKRFQLTAYDRDYTIRNLYAQRNVDYQIRFDGLTDGQVIRKGESVSFDLILMTPDYIPIAPTGQNLGEGLIWNFDIAEKPGWNFNFQPYFYATYTTTN